MSGWFVINLLLLLVPFYNFCVVIAYLFFAILLTIIVNIPIRIYICMLLYYLKTMIKLYTLKKLFFVQNKI